uniref:Uncharacterized protein n=1 Tax=uncultured marine microorganism HF4000_APKG8C21 TaxID=455553 RepID=B3TA17_9ZZZZ|nr:hypothetical protein ALOHA_HF4000APKG8C21ctg1g14 [uncultured marine microorganism HF4000_APKG8C21]
MPSFRPLPRQTRGTERSSSLLGALFYGSLYVPPAATGVSEHESPEFRRRRGTLPGARTWRWRTRPGDYSKAPVHLHSGEMEYTLSGVIMYGASFTGGGCLPMEAEVASDHGPLAYPRSGLGICVQTMHRQRRVMGWTDCRASSHIWVSDGRGRNKEGPTGSQRTAHLA